MHEFDAAPARSADVAGRHRAAADREPPRRRAHDPRADAREGRLPRAVLSDDRVDASGVERDADLAQRHDVAVRDRDVVARECAHPSIGLNGTLSEPATMRTLVATIAGHAARKRAAVAAGA